MSEQKSIAIGAELTPETWANFVARLRHDCVGDGVKDHYTADAIFIVQAKRRITGIDREYTDQWIVQFDESEWLSPLEYWNDLDADGKAALDAKVRDDYDCGFLDLDCSDQWGVLEELDDHTVTGWDESWEYVSAHFTKDAAEAFIKRKKHDYRLGLRVYVEAQVYCWEYNAIKKAMLSGRLTLSSSEENGHE